MTRRRFLVTVVSISVAGFMALGVWGLFLWCPAGQVTQCNYDKVTVGMTLPAVQALLGKPERKLTGDDFLPNGYRSEANEFYRWQGDGYVIVGFTDGRGAWTRTSGSTACSEAAAPGVDGGAGVGSDGTAKYVPPAGVDMKRLSTRCGIFLAAAVATTGGVALVTLLPRYTGSGITEANYRRIMTGMTEAEVETVLGCPPGNYTDGRALCLRAYTSFPGLGEREWVGLRGTVVAWFRVEDRRLVSAEFRETLLWPQPGWWDRAKAYCRYALGL
jgi:outer membrane protein assembly factor BamE (lipoprotein component of BamABCDE complex)